MSWCVAVRNHFYKYLHAVWPQSCIYIGMCFVGLSVCAIFLSVCRLQSGLCMQPVPCMNSTWALHGFQLGPCMDVNLGPAWVLIWALHEFHPGSCMELKLSPAWDSNWAWDGSQTGPSMDVNLGQSGSQSGPAWICTSDPQALKFQTWLS